MNILLLIAVLIAGAAALTAAWKSLDNNFLRQQAKERDATLLNLAKDNEKLTEQVGEQEKTIEDLEEWRKKLFNQQDGYISRIESLETELTKHKRVRDKRGIFVRKDGTFTPKKKQLPAICDEVVEPVAEVKKHTLKHGMTVKNPTEDQAKAIFEAAKEVGILRESGDDINQITPWIWYAEECGVTSCRSMRLYNDIYTTATEFLQRIKGEVA